MLKDVKGLTRREYINTRNVMCMAKTAGNPKAEIRWESTEFHCLHSLLLSCESML